MKNSANVGSPSQVPTPAKLWEVWKTSHRDFKTVIDGVRHVLVLREGGTQLVRLGDLTSEEVERKLRPRS